MLRWLEQLALFGFAPLALALLADGGGGIFLPLYAGAAGAALLLRRIGRGPALRLDWDALDRAYRRRLAGRTALVAAGIAVVVALDPGLDFFGFPRERPALWALVMCLYPLLSVYPQELLLRAFHFERYAGLVARPAAFLALNAVVFGWIHIVFWNPFAVLLSIPAGWLLADTYSRTRSLGAVCVEHAVYGNLVFTLGLGRYFFHGAVGG
ncbi:MAG: CPBP family glutamic-type intramembrane protease [Candidatus Sumerlaeia bacterium]|nr:CPBP family glutamic-type intramembrane protease [Candidatus Sumerlaeia bacterium]